MPGGPAQAADQNANRQHREQRRRRREAELVTPDGLLKLIETAGRTGDHRLAVQMPLDVHGQAVGRLVAARAVFLQALHHDPVQVAPHADESLSVAADVAGSGFSGFWSSLRHVGCSSIVLKPRRGTRRFLLPDGAAHFVQPGLAIAFWRQTASCPVSNS